MGVGLWLVSVLMSLKQASGVMDAWNVVLPDTIVGVRGSCVLVPCTFTIPEERNPNLQVCSNREAWWVTDIGSRTAASQAKVVGDVRSFNCTTVFSGLTEKRHVFYFRLECSRFTFPKAARISLQRAPPPPQLDAVDLLLEGQRVELQCSVPVPCPTLPPSITWLPQDGALGQQTRLQKDEDQLLTLTSTLTFIASAGHHNRSVTCSASYPRLDGSISGPRSSTLVLSVFYPPRSTEARLLHSGPEGRTLTLVCSSDANPPVGLYTWYRVGAAGQLTRRGGGQAMVFTVAPSDSGAFLCEAENTIGFQRSRPVPLLAAATTARPGSGFRAWMPYALWALLFLLYILMVAVHVHKYQRLSKRLKQIEAQKENTYARLRQGTVVSDYDIIQVARAHPPPPAQQSSSESFTKPKAVAPTSDVPDYVTPE